jgi:hypothetical protein
MFERVFAATVLAVCALLLLRLLIGERRRRRLDAAAYRVVARLRRIGSSWRRWRRHRRDAQHAARMADEAIRRARDRGDWDGNVYTPKSFRKPPRDDSKPPRDKMH